MLEGGGCGRSQVGRRFNPEEEAGSEYKPREGYGDERLPMGGDVGGRKEKRNLEKSRIRWGGRDR